jgi:hypothetical protein
MPNDFVFFWPQFSKHLPPKVNNMRSLQASDEDTISEDVKIVLAGDSGAGAFYFIPLPTH